MSARAEVPPISGSPSPSTTSNVIPDGQKYKEPALALGLKACWSSPISDQSGATTGVFAFYYHEIRGPTELEESMVETCLHLCAIALERHERVMERERRATIDTLTELPNRAAFNTALSHLSCDETGAWALFVLDLDNLKTVNDTFGHQAGDSLLQVVARRVAAAVVPDMTFRLGGDEFAILIQAQTALLDLDACAARILSSLTQLAQCDGHTIVPKATMGGAVVSPADRTAETVRQNADFALYHAKETGRGGFVRYWPGIGTRITHRLVAIQDVAAALREDRIEAYYQPIVRLDSREIVGVEALCRLVTTDGEVVPAARFHEATSDAHVACALTDRMLEIVASDIRRRLDLGIAFQHVGIDVSSADFHGGKLTDRLSSAFGRLDVSLEHVIVEVTEAVYLGHLDHIPARMIKAMRSEGLRVALDDFGTGFASLTHLMTVPIDVLKIDKSFVDRLAPGDSSVPIIKGLLNIARDLGIRVIIEGIETEGQAAQLQELGCVFGQGYLFSRAVDRHAAVDLLRRYPQILPVGQNRTARGLDFTPALPIAEGFDSGDTWRAVPRRVKATR
jgi:diguanylate cyclase (GGDEF)-like protein